MRNTYLLLWLMLFPCGARAQAIQNMDFSFLFGASHASSQTVAGSVALPANTGFGMRYGYGYQILRRSAASLWVEYTPAFTISNQVTASIPGMVDRHWSIYAAGLRFMVPVQERVSLYGAAGGGAGSFSQTFVTGGDNPNVRSVITTHGVFDFGGGIDVRLSQRFSIRVELRDFVTGAGLSGVDGRHHLLPVAGMAFHF